MSTGLLTFHRCSTNSRPQSSDAFGSAAPTCPAKAVLVPVFQTMFVRGVRRTSPNLDSPIEASYGTAVTKAIGLWHCLAAPGLTRREFQKGRAGRKAAVPRGLSTP